MTVGAQRSALAIAGTKATCWGPPLALGWSGCDSRLVTPVLVSLGPWFPHLCPSCSPHPHPSEQQNPPTPPDPGPVHLTDQNQASLFPSSQLWHPGAWDL